MDARTALTTTRAVRRRLDAGRPVPRAVVEQCIEIAAQAPSGGNRQRLRWVILEDPDVRRDVVEAFREPAIARFREVLAGATDPGARRAYQGGIELLERMETIPVLALPCMTGGRAEPLSYPAAAGFYGSAIPAVWSFQLALRTFGLGSTYTTVHLGHEREVAEILGIPENVRQIALLPVAYTLGEDFRPARRLPVAQTMSYDSWGTAFADA
ncbi:hypothetical protein ASD65_09885 [Microbacterium sp. Root61]|uniref:nitroreductase family protein n=1 Tax=Microbacterium sp. Root61 TaxID=1736570 RepID=UPI0006F2715D|nr:nitroreductase family protein [Microbacterium sp. Root61]KRA24690.1 hypothetical protein ASD65_09885 [Microbacterium sp. Root61]